MSSSAVRPTKQLGGGCAVLFGLPFILAGLAVGWFLYFPAIGGWWSARSWEEVPCWIEKADMESSHSGKGGTTYHTTASFRYRYGGRTYHSEAVNFMGGSDNIGDFQQKAYAQIRPFEGKDRPFRCYVNPAWPEQAVLFRDLRWGLFLMMSVFPMAFPLAGGFVAVGGAWQAWKASREKKLTQLHAGEPWRWRPEWSGEMIQASKSGLGFLLAIAGWVLLVQVPLALSIIVSGALLDSMLAVFALLPFLLALIPLWFAWKRLQTRMAIGNPSLWLKQMPVRPGTTLEGELRFDRVLSPREVIEARLLCQRKITRGNGKGTNTTTETLWSHSEMLSASEARRDIGGVALPLQVEIPRGLPCSIVEDAAFIADDSEQHVWSLELAPASGGKAVTLPLPVFVSGDEAKLAESDTNYDVEAIAPSTDQLTERLQRCGVTAVFDDSGIPTLIDCPPGRYRALSIFLLLFGVIWSVIFFVLVSQGAPWLFRIVWGVTSPLILGSGLWTLLHRRLVEITPDELRIKHSIGPFYSWKETFAPRHITGFTHDTNMQSGNQFYYRVRTETTFGKTKTLADGFTESVTAETLAKRLDDWRKGA